MNYTSALRNISKPVISINVEGVTTSCILLAALIITIITNCLTIVVIAKSPGLRTLTNTFLVSMSAGDELYALFAFGTVSTIIVYFFNPFNYSRIQLQAIVNFAWGTLIHISNGNLILVSLERWLYITQPFLYLRLVSAKSVITGVVVTWVSALAINIPCVFPVFTGSRRLYFQTMHGYVYPIIHTLCSILLAFIYVHISLITLQHLKKISKIQPHHYSLNDNSSVRIPPASRSPFSADSPTMVPLNSNTSPHINNKTQVRPFSKPSPKAMSATQVPPISNTSFQASSSTQDPPISLPSLHADSLIQIRPISKSSLHAENWKAIKLLITVCGLFFVFVSPYVYFSSYVLLNPKKARDLRSWQNPLLILLSVYHCSNFFVYVLRIRQFRKVLKDGLKKCFRMCVNCNIRTGITTSNIASRDRTISVIEF